MRSVPIGLSILFSLGPLTLAPRAQECAPPLPGLVVWWDADDVKWEPGHSFYPVATDITDRIAGPPLALVAIAQNPDPSLWIPQFAPGKVGQAFSFDPAHPQFAGLAMYRPEGYTGNELQLTTALSIEMWMKWNPAVPFYNAFFGLIDTLTDGYYFTNYGFLLYGDGSDIYGTPNPTSPVRFRLGSGSQTSEVSGTSNIKDGAWHHIVATFDASLPTANQKVYVDGVLQGSANWNQPIAYSGPGYSIGRGPTQSIFRGLIDEVMVYDRALTAEEIDLAYHSPGRCRPSFPARPSPSGVIGPFTNLLPEYAYARVGEDMDLDGDVLVVAEPANGDYHLTGAHVFRRDGESWVHEQMIAPAPSGWGSNGRSVAVSGDVIVQGIGRGFVVNRFDGASWNEEFRKVEPSPPYERGFDVDVCGDTLVVGAPGGQLTNVEIFRYVSGQWQQEAVINGPDWSQFGRAVALEGDLLVVGARTASLVGSIGGALYVYRRTGSTWSLVDTVTPDEVAPGRSSYDNFGLGSDLDIDGERVLAVAWGSVASFPGDLEYVWQGSGFVLDLSGGNAVLEGELRSDLVTKSLGHGTGSARLRGNLAVMGAWYGAEPSGYRANSTGSACVFARRSGTWSEVGRCRTSVGDIGLGRSVAFDGGRVLAMAPGQKLIWIFPGFEAALNPSRPIANAGVDRIVDEGAPVTLDGSASFDGDGDPLGYSWTQIGGTSVTLANATSATPSFTAPWVALGGETLSFQLVVDDGDLESDPDVVNITIANVNSIPVAEAGADQTVAEGSPVTLSGVDSYDVDDEALTFQWTQLSGPLVALAGAEQAQASFTAPAVGPAGAALAFQLVVGDGQATSVPDSVTVTVTNVNNPPVAVAGSNQTVDEGTQVFLDGSGSSDPDGDALSWSWAQVSGPVVTLSNATSATPSFTAPDVTGVVELEFSLTVSDGLGGLSEASSTKVAVRDVNAPPDCGQARADTPLLWPPNHKMVPIRIVGVSDPEDQSILITILDVWQDEPVNGLGDGDTGPADAAIQGDTVLLRAERSGLGDGRVYRIRFRATDASGAWCEGSVEVGVPHDKKSTPIDSGTTVPSTD